MKKYITTFLLLFIPFVAMAADHCTNPAEYTDDRRCYVTDKQKKVKPYNAVVALIDGNRVKCTGTIVKAKDGKPYLLTAKHCTDDGDNMVQSKLKIKLQDGRTLDVTKNNVGNYDIAGDTNHDGDWAIYKLNTSNVPMVNRTSKIEISVPILPYGWPYDARVVGYGSLKIMSDKEISDFKLTYIKYLKDKKDIKSNGYEEEYGFSIGGVDKNNAYVKSFIHDNIGYYSQLLDHELKVSYCRYTSENRQIGCQAWGGNSGGPIFDDSGNIMGILTRGSGVIGGYQHSGSEAGWKDTRGRGVSLLK